MSTLASSSAADIVRVVWSSILASVAVSVVFSVAIVGLMRASELRRSSRGGTAAAYTVVATCALLVCVAGVVYSLILVGEKN
jgi:hypothetical protein